MSIYKRGEQWWIEYQYKKKRYREAVGPDEDLAQDVLSKRRVEIRENRFFPEKVKPPEPITFHDFAKEYLQWARVNKKPSSVQRDICSLRALGAEFETKTIQEITAWAIEKYKAKRKANVKPATLNREIALIKHLYTKAIEWGRMKENPAKKVKLLRGEIKRVRYLMPDEVQNLLSNCKDDLRPIVTLAVHTGMRKGEILSLTWPQVNLEQGIITILDTKNNERKDIPMDETVKALLKGVKRRGDLVFPSHPAKIHSAFCRAVKTSGIDDFRFHDLRHTFASNLVMNGEDLNTVRELLGHKGLAMTLRYAHLAPGKKARAVKILDEVMSQNPPQAAKVVNLTYQNDRGFRR